MVTSAPCEDHLDHVFGIVDPGGGGQRCIHPPVEYGYPAEHQPRSADDESTRLGLTSSRSRSMSGLVEPVEEDEPIRSGVGEPASHVRHRRRMGLP